LAGYQPEVRLQGVRVREARHVVDRAPETRGCYRSDPWRGHQNAADRIRLDELFELLVGILHLHVERFDNVELALDVRRNTCRQLEEPLAYSTGEVLGAARA